jgi:regulation of enolase protein 1 (concanavalin A-like superfamily)
MARAGEQAGLVLYCSDENWIKLVVEGKKDGSSQVLVSSILDHFVATIDVLASSDRFRPAKTRASVTNHRQNGKTTVILD